jgi:hypothetical protein
MLIHAPEAAAADLYTSHTTCSIQPGRQGLQHHKAHGNLEIGKPSDSFMVRKTAECHAVTACVNCAIASSNNLHAKELLDGHY